MRVDRLLSREMPAAATLAHAFSPLTMHNGQLANRQQIMSAWWIVQKTRDKRFPYRIRIEQEGRVLLVVCAQTAWPGAGKQIFCLRETEPAPDEVLSAHERVAIAHLSRLARKLSVTLDRGQRKRCGFLKLEKQRKDGSGS